MILPALSPLRRRTSVLNPRTEGIKYAGSKLRMLPHIMKMVCSLDDVYTVLDAFSGSTRVSQALYQSGRYAVTSNDIAVWSEVFATCYLQAPRREAYYRQLIDRLNALPGHEGWFTLHYAPHDDRTPDEEMRKYPFQRKNTMRLDSIRECIAEWRAAGTIDVPTERVLLTSLILALDVVDSTIGHFSSYLKRWSARSYRDLTLRLPRLCYNECWPAASVCRSNVFDLHGEWDLAYLDPPYGSANVKMPSSRVRYAAYYHLWKSVVLNDQPTLFGAAGRREDSRDGISASVFEDFHMGTSGRLKAIEAIERLVQQVKARYILLSYNSSGGRVTREEIQQMLSENGTLMDVMAVDYAHHNMANMFRTRKWCCADKGHQEYLFLLRKE